LYDRTRETQEKGGQNVLCADECEETIPGTIPGILPETRTPLLPGTIPGT
jgi:hypothetical protein